MCVVCEGWFTCVACSRAATASNSPGARQQRRPLVPDCRSGCEDSFCVAPPAQRKQPCHAADYMSSGARLKILICKGRKARCLSTCFHAGLHITCAIRSGKCQSEKEIASICSAAARASTAPESNTKEAVNNLRSSLPGLSRTLCNHTRYHVHF